MHLMFSQQCLQKLVNAAERAMSTRDLPHRENFDLFDENNAGSTTSIDQVNGGRKGESYEL